MRIPDKYEEMVREIKSVAARYRFCYEKDQLEDNPPYMPESGHLFRAVIYLTRNNDDFVEDAPIPIST
jgi:hypothetical protein